MVSTSAEDVRHRRRFHRHSHQCCPKQKVKQVTIITIARQQYQLGAPRQSNTPRIPRAYHRRQPAVNLPDPSSIPHCIASLPPGEKKRTNNLTHPQKPTQSRSSISRNRQQHRPTFPYASSALPLDRSSPSSASLAASHLWTRQDKIR